MYIMKWYITKFQNRLDTVGKFLYTVGKSVRIRNGIFLLQTETFEVLYEVNIRIVENLTTPRLHHRPRSPRNYSRIAIILHAALDIRGNTQM